MSAVMDVQHLHRSYRDTVGTRRTGGLRLPIPNMPATLPHISHVTPLGAAVPALAAARFFRWE